VLPAAAEDATIRGTTNATGGIRSPAPAPCDSLATLYHDGINPRDYLDHHGRPQFVLEDRDR
jgi:hypothetical protein